MAEDEYYTYDKKGSVIDETLKTNDNNVISDNVHTETIPHNLVIDGDLDVDFQDGNDFHTFSVISDNNQIKINDTKILIDPNDVQIMNGNLTIDETKVVNNKPVEINQATQTNIDGLTFIFSGNNWKIYLDVNNDLVFSYNDIIVQKLSHD